MTAPCCRLCGFLTKIIGWDGLGRATESIEAERVATEQRRCDQANPRRAADRPRDHTPRPFHSPGERYRRAVRKACSGDTGKDSRSWPGSERPCATVGSDQDRCVPSTPYFRARRAKASRPPSTMRVTARRTSGVSIAPSPSPTPRSPSATPSSACATPSARSTPTPRSPPRSPAMVSPRPAPGGWRSSRCCRSPRTCPTAAPPMPCAPPSIGSPCLGSPRPTPALTPRS